MIGQAFFRAMQRLGAAPRPFVAAPVGAVAATTSAPAWQSAATLPPVCPDGRIEGTPRGTCTLAGRRIGYGMRVGFSEPSPQTGARHAGIYGWAMDLDSFIPIGTLCVTTEAGVAHRLQTTERRTDVLNPLNVPREKRSAAAVCGFSGYVADPGKQIGLTLELDGDSHQIGTGYPEPPKLLAGAQGWLFLAGDRNDSPEQFTGTHQPSREWLDGWSRYFAAYDRLCQDGGARHVRFVVAPSKETLFPEYYPLARGGATPFDRFWDLFGDKPGMIFPGPQLSPLREVAYDRVETHWTDFGARLVSEHLLQDCGMGTPTLPFDMTMALASGDLGHKAAPPITTYRPRASWPNPSQIIFDNFVHHHGRIRVTQNAQPLKRQSCVIFGDSFGEYMERYLTAVFARVVFVHSAGAWDPAILTHERPALTILQCAERFLTRAPAPEVSTANVIATKRRLNQVTDPAPLSEIMARWTDPNIEFYR